MKKPSWLLGVLLISFFLLAVLNQQRQSTLSPYIRAEKVIKIDSFAHAKSKLSKHDQEFLKLWESMLTGRTAPLSKWMKSRYQELGLQHLFTPSGFHLSAVLSPFLKFSPSIRVELVLLALVGVGLLFLPGQWALKRMVLIKSGQRLWGHKTGFIAALLIDVLIGSFRHSPLSFSYSFLFLGIIYSKLRGPGLILWFFLAQVILAYFQQSQISPLLLLISPVLNFAFGLAMPLLFLLAIPLWNWQMHIGIGILKILQWLVNFAADCLPYFPLWQVHFGLLACIGAFLFKRWKLSLFFLFMLSNGLNLDLQKRPGPITYEYVPSGNLIKMIERGNETIVYFEDGRCKRKLIRGNWWERCFPKKRRSTWSN